MIFQLKIMKSTYWEIFNPRHRYRRIIAYQKLKFQIWTLNKYADRENERKISIVEGNSPERNPKVKLNTTSEDNRPYQASTYYSNTINKSSKKSGFKFSSDFFSFEEDEVNHEKTNKNKEIFGILSEDDFEKFSSAIEQDYQNKKQKNRISSHKKPFASWVEDPKAEDENSL